MYPELLRPLLAVLLLFAGAGAYVLLARSVSRRLALRQLTRRPGEAVLAIIGATLGTAIIVGALVVGDTLNSSVRQTAYRTLGPIDERVVSTDPGTGAYAARLLDGLRADRQVDGVLSAEIEPAAAATRLGTVSGAAEPRVQAWDLDYGAAAGFGGSGASGLAIAPPSPGYAVVNAPLAASLRAGPGDPITVFLYGHPSRFTIGSVVPDRGLAGAGFGSTTNRNVFLPPGTVGNAAYISGTSAHVVTFVSNAGNVETGAGLTTPVTARIRELTQGLPVTVDTPKKSVLDAAKRTGDSLGALFLMIGSFSIIAGALLLVNIFTMLAEERKSQLGMLRAVGMRRSRLVESFSLEGGAYALAASVPGVALGLAVGWAVALVSAQIFRSFSATGNGLSIKFAVTGTSVVNGVALGLVISLTTIVLTSVRVSRFNVIAAIRDLPTVPTEHTRRVTMTVATVLAAVFAAASVPAIASSSAEGMLLFPALAAIFALPLARHWVPARPAYSVAALAILAWTLLAPLLRPRMFDNPSMAVFVILGTLVAFSAVVLVSENQAAILRPVRALIQRPSEAGLALRLAVAYPLAKRFRTGATLVMYTLITLILVLLVEVTGVITASIDAGVARATAGYGLRIDVNPAATAGVLQNLRTGRFAADIAQITPLTTADVLATDPGHRTTANLPAVAVGVPAGALSDMRMQSRLPGLGSDRAVWRLMSRDSRYVVLDSFFNAAGGPNGKYYGPGDRMRMTDPRSGLTQTRTIAGILSSSLAFYAASGQASGAYPIVSSSVSVRQLTSSGAQVTAALLRTRNGVDPQRLAPDLQAAFLSASLVASPIAADARQLYSANIAFFRLMEGFLALGLLIGITGLGVVMVRAVRERRRTIGVLRALGFQARTVRRAFLAESGFVALEGIVVGSLLGVLTTWLMYQKSAMFDTAREGFPVEWPWIVGLALATLLASILATVPPARRAAHVLPALAVRVAD